MKFRNLCLLLCLICLPAFGAQPREEAVTLPITGGELHGTLDIPAGTGPFPVALILVGSGPVDRDGNAASVGFYSDSYKELAAALAAHGIASLRYDKRGAGVDMSLALSEAKLRFDDFVGDAIGWGRLLRKDSRFSRLIIIGHSEGSLIGMLAASGLGADGYVSLAGAGESAAKLILSQLHPQLPPDLYAESQRIVNALQHGKTVDKVSPQLAVLFRASGQPYLISWFRYDPAQEIQHLRMPALIIQGGRDIQVSISDAKALAEADPSAKLVVIPKMNHVLKDVGDTRDSNLAAYSNPKLPLDTTLINTVTRFISQLPATRPASDNT